jgi:hypothetical protein
MKKIKLLVVTILILFVILHLQGCCTMKGCVDTRGVVVSLSGFSPNEIDTITLYKFKKNTNFTDLIQVGDMRISSSSQGVFFAYPVNDYMSIDYDYKIEIKNMNRLFFISNFKMKRDKCNLCLFGIRQDFYESIENFEVNGQINIGHTLNISK